MMQTNTYIERINKVNIIMKILDSTHVIYTGEMKKIDINGFNKRSQSKYITEKIVADFELINKLIDDYDLINAATILRATLENIFYIIAVNYDKKLKISLDTTISDFRKVLKENENDCFFNNIDLDSLNRAYKQLCKFVHPCSMKEYLSCLTNTKKYRKYMHNNIKHIMVTIEYIYLSFLYKNNVDSLYSVTMQLAVFANFYNVSLFLQESEGDTSFIKEFMFYDIDNKYVKEVHDMVREINDNLKCDPMLIEKQLKLLSNEFDVLIAQTEYCDVVNSILKRKNKIFV